jgi:hypothetical protein
MTARVAGLAYLFVLILYTLAWFGVGFIMGVML